nr:photosystem I assembly protein Ycf4 [Cyanidioschyzonaceae sp. 2]
MSIQRERIPGSRRWSNVAWCVILASAGSGFWFTGIHSDLALQGAVMCFYGSIAFTLSIYLLLTIWWDVGGGYNEYDLDKKSVTICRKGFGQQQIRLEYKREEIQSLKVVVKDGLNPKREIYLCTNSGAQIPLTAVGEPMPLAQLEQKATQLAKWLDLAGIV